MKIDLIGMILNNTARRCFEGAIIDDDGQELDAAHSLDYMIMEYAKVKNGGESSTVVVSKYLMPNVEVTCLRRHYGEGQVDCRVGPGAQEE